MRLANTSLAIENNATVQGAVQQVVADSLKRRARNTRSYEPKQGEWVRWCNGRQFVDESVVTEGKILLFLEEVVRPRGSRHKQDGKVAPLSVEVSGIGFHPHPRGKALSEYLRTHKRDRTARRREEFNDRGKGTMQDTYSLGKLRNVRTYFMELNDGRALHDRADILFGHALMARGETTRKLHLPDLFSMELTNEGPTKCVAAFAVMDQGKVNQFGRIENDGCIRYRDIILCPIGALDIYLFWRFQVAENTFPDMRVRST
ncbi:Centromere DNA-binding protein complex CBF3 subunit domain-containing protein [Phytophthora infestans]|uniref:Centromere DNA-binding protein complex CBF3 subunit domain-containing protein n=1 Tax=Phytophthora infestans TaxID=4787 RepID=A0A8S9V087_PHYIN|nr:Centromere DNA-binding protein complex CBF3 subunit domain-containing protein [Phytophthora infestans]